MVDNSMLDVQEAAGGGGILLQVLLNYESTPSVCSALHCTMFTADDNSANVLH